MMNQELGWDGSLRVLFWAESHFKDGNQCLVLVRALEGPPEKLFLGSRLLHNDRQKSSFRPAVVGPWFANVAQTHPFTALALAVLVKCQAR